MKAIITKYSAPAHISVTDGDTRMRLPYPHDVNGIEEKHMWAAIEFARRKGLSGELAQGFIKDGQWVHVWINDHRTVTAVVTPT